MSRILRTMKFVRRLNINDWRLNQFFIPINNKALFNTESRIRCLSVVPERNVKIAENVDHVFNSFSNLETNFKTRGDLSKFDVESIINKIRNNEQRSEQSIQLLSSSCHFSYSYTKQIRAKIINDIWNMVKRLHPNLNLDMYNMLLQSYLHNKVYFDPFDILSEINSKNITPNHETFEKLIEQYGRIGDIKNITKLLEIMNKDNIPLNTNMFDSLIEGHAVCGNEKNALNVINIMQNSGINPYQSTYTEILCMYAQSGDMDKIKDVFDECSKKRIYFKNYNLIKVMYKLALNDHIQKMNEILPFLNRDINSNKVVNNYVELLIEEEKVGQAFEFYKLLMSVSKIKDYNYGFCFIQKMITSNADPKKIIKYISLLNQSDNANIWEFALMNTYKHNLYDLVIPLLKEMKKSHFLKDSYFHPLLTKNKNNVQGTMNILNEMVNDFRIIPLLSTLSNFVLHNINEDYKQQLEYLKSTGIRFSKCANAMVYYMLSKNDIEEASKFVLKNNVAFNMMDLKQNLTNAIGETKDVISAAKIFYKQFQVINHPKYADDIRDIYNYEPVIINVINRFRNDIDFTSDFLNILISKSVPVSTDTITVLKNICTNETHIDLINKLKNMESIVVKNNLKDPNLNMIMKYMLDKNTSDLLNSLQELQQQNYKFDPNDSECILNYFISRDNFEGAEKWLHYMLNNDDFIELKHETFYAYVTKVLEVKNIDELIDVLKYPFKVHIQERNSQSCIDFFNKLTTKYPDKITQIFQMLEKKQITHITNIEIIYKQLMNINKPETVVKLFEWIHNNYNSLAHKMLLMKYFIEIDNLELLQQLTDICVSSMGKQSALFDLGVCFLESNRINQAEKILSMAKVLSGMQVETLVNFYIRRKQFGLLEQFISTVNNCRPSLIDHGLNAIYKSINHLNLEDLKAMYKQFEHTRLISIHTLNIMSKQIAKLENTILNENETKRYKGTLEISYKSDVIQAHIDNNEIDEAQDLLQSLLRKNEKIHKDSKFMNCCVDIVSILLQRNELSELYVLLQTLKSTGVSFILFSKLVSERLLDKCDHNKIMEIYNNVLDYDHCSTVFFNILFNTEWWIKLLHNNPELVEKFKDLADKAINKSLYAPINCMWIIEVMNESPNADIIWEQHLQKNPLLMFSIAYALKSLDKLDKFPYFCEKLITKNDIQSIIVDKCFKLIFLFLMNSDHPDKYKLLYQCMYINLKVNDYSKISGKVIDSLRNNLSEGMSIEELQNVNKSFRNASIT